MSNWKLKSADIPVPVLSEFDPYRNAMMEKGYAKSRYLLAESIAISALDLLEEIERLLDAGIDILVDSPMNERIDNHLKQYKP